MTLIVTVSILAYNRIDCTRNCIESVMLSSNGCEFILTDNGSNDGTGEYFDRLAYTRPDIIRVVHNDRNLGFQIPHTHALSLTRTPFFLLLNNDTQVPAGWIEALIDPMRHDLQVVLSGPSGHCCSINEQFHGYPGQRFEYLEGSCLLCRTEIVRRHGLFADYLEFAYGEDSDLCLRMRCLGYKMARVPLRIRHVGQATSRSVPGIRAIQERNHAILRTRWAHYLKVRKLDYPTVIVRKGAIGDVLLTTPIIESLHAFHPISPIHVKTDFPELFDGNPFVTSASKDLTIHADARVIKLDMAYENDPSWPIIDSYSRVADAKLITRELTFVVRRDGLQWAEELFKKESRPKVVMHIGPTTWPGKNWTGTRWREIVMYMRSRGWATVLVGTLRNLHVGKVEYDMRGRTTIHSTAAIMAMSQLFIGLDSFPLHLAMAVKLPAIGLFGATTPGLILSDGIVVSVQGNPNKVPCIGERHRMPGSEFVKCDGACMRAIDTAMVKKVIEDLAGVS